MAIHIDGKNLQDIHHQLSLRNFSAIGIRWRHGDLPSDKLHGCIVDARNYVDRVEKDFPTVNEALDYIKKLLLQHESEVEESKKQVKAA